jgi:hypothetical protein
MNPGQVLIVRALACLSTNRSVGMNPQISQMAADSKEEQSHGVIGQLLNRGRPRLELKCFGFFNLRKSAQSAD